MDAQLQIHLHQHYPQSGWGNPAELALPSFDNPSVFDTPVSGAAWPDYGAGAVNNAWDSSALSLATYDLYGQQWPMSPSRGTFSDSYWSPSDQPLPSPMSEVASFDFTPSPMPDDTSYFGLPSPAIAPSQQPAATRQHMPNSPATTTSSALSTPVLPAKDKGKQKSTGRASSKRTAEQTPVPINSSRPRNLKRHRSDPPPSTPASASAPSSLTTTTSTTTLGGVLPANVDPRIAAERIRREAWERCRAEAQAMAQRRSLLRDHEQGALEREARKLQASLDRMREAAASRGRRG